VIKHKQKI